MSAILDRKTWPLVFVIGLTACSTQNDPAASPFVAPSAPMEREVELPDRENTPNDSGEPVIDDQSRIASFNYQGKDTRPIYISKRFMTDVTQNFAQLTNEQIAKFRSYEFYILPNLNCGKNFTIGGDGPGNDTDSVGFEGMLELKYRVLLAEGTTRLEWSD